MTDLSEKKWPKHPNQAKNEHLLKVRFTPPAGVDRNQFIADMVAVIAEANLTEEEIHQCGVGEVGSPGEDQGIGIFISAKSHKYAAYALTVLVQIALIKGYAPHSHTFNQSHFKKQMA